MRIFSLVLLAGLAACSGTMTGQVRGTGQAITFNYETGLDHDNLTAVIDAEEFSGKAIMDGSGSTYITSWDPNVPDFFGTSTTNRVAATLLGDKGSSLVCTLRYASSDGIAALGGVGVCNHSDGRVIDVVW
jgi:hypothetical protein